ncbi:MAG: hypothetical protein ACRC5A_08550 [Enterobacteriaceae bacterium]
MNTSHALLQTIFRNRHNRIDHQRAEKLWFVITTTVRLTLLILSVILSKSAWAEAPKCGGQASLIPTTIAQVVSAFDALDPAGGELSITLPDGDPLTVCVQRRVLVTVSIRNGNAPPQSATVYAGEIAGQPAMITRLGPDLSLSWRDNEQMHSVNFVVGSDALQQSTLPLSTKASAGTHVDDLLPNPQQGSGQGVLNASGPNKNLKFWVFFHNDISSLHQSDAQILNTYFI